MIFFQILAASSNNIIPSVTPTDDLQTFVTNNRVVLLGEGTYTINSSLTIPNGTSLVGIPGKTIISCPTVTGVSLNMPNDVFISGITFKGAGYVAGTVTNYTTARDKTGIGSISGIKITGQPRRLRIDNCRFMDFKRAGYEIVNAMNDEEGIKVTNCFASNCYIGFWIGERAEYSQYTNISANSCEIGVYVEAGNTILNGIHADRNKVGVVISGYNVGNDSHGTIGSSTMNHNTIYSLMVIDITVGFTFTGCHIWDGKVLVNNSTGFLYTGGALIGSVEIAQGAGTTNGAHGIHSTMFRSGSYNSGTITQTGTVNISLKNNFYMGGEVSTALNN